MHNYSTYRAAQLVGKIKFDKKSCTLTPAFWHRCTASLTRGRHGSCMQ
uniref:Uncharacterized protein n=1 Tax=Rhizophora mucronata TaxID=61149 RepID=A0A2P2MNL6_RHIMU